MTHVGPLELAGVGFVFGIGAGVLCGLLNAHAFWPIIGAGAVGIILVPVVARLRAAPLIGSGKAILAPRMARKA